MKYAQHTFLALFAFLLIGLTACAPEKDPDLINTMVAEADSVQTRLDAVGNAKQRLGNIMRAMQALTPAQRDSLQEKLSAYELKINDVLNAFRNTRLPESDSLASFRQTILNYESGLIKKSQAKEKLEIFVQSVGGIQEKVAALESKVAAVESELGNVLPIDSGTISARPQGTDPGVLAPGGSGATGTAPAAGSVPSPTSPTQLVPSPTAPTKTGGTLTTPDKKQ
ncbi:MAG: hypothetical protein RL742_781 [Bacteroidota bacterium]|jgi:hypothetical protein